MAALATAVADQSLRRSTSLVQSSIPSGWRNVPSQLQQVEFSHEGNTVAVGYRIDHDGTITAEIDGDPVGTARLAGGSASERIGLEVGGHLRWYRIRRVGDRRDVATAEGGLELSVLSRFPSTGIEEEPGSLHAPMPGKVITVNVAVDERVEEGQPLLVMEAMKMEHTLRAPFAGTITDVRCGPGEQVDADAVLVVVEEL